MFLCEVLYFVDLIFVMIHPYLNKYRIRNKNSIFAVLKTFGRMNMDLDIFKSFLEEMECEYVDLPLYSHVGWLTIVEVMS